MRSELLSKSYDLRGIYGSDIINSDYFLLARAFVKTFSPKTVAVGCDARLSSDSLKKAFIAGVRSMGAKAVDIGLCSSDMLQFSSLMKDIDLATMITASHNPKEYNGMKSCQHNAKPINLKEWGPKLSEHMENDTVSYREETDYPAETYEYRDITDAWVEHVAGFTSGETFEGMHVVADAGNGTAGVFMEALAKKLNFTLTPLYFEPDGNFPNHHPSPIESKNTRDMVARVKELGADVGVAFDGDADRAVLCDEKGNIISASTLCVAIAKALLEKYPGSKILGNAIVSKSVEETVLEMGGKYVRSIVNPVKIKQTLAEDAEIVFGGEHSGHYYFRENANADSGVIAFIHFLVEMKKQKKTASELKQKLDKYIAIEETNFKIPTPKETIDAIEKIFLDDENVVKTERFDGLSVFFEFGWFNLRPSSNEPLVRLNMEANSAENLEKLKQLVFPHLS